MQTLRTMYVCHVQCRPHTTHLFHKKSKKALLAVKLLGVHMSFKHYTVYVVNLAGSDDE